MKKNLFILLLFFTSFNLFSQSYTPLLKEGNKWWESYWDSSGYNFYGRENYYYFINGESLLNGFIYKKIYYNKYETCLSPLSFFSCYPTNNPDQFVGLYREDILGKKVYQYDGGDSSGDFLVYDFSKNIGEAMTPYQLTIEEINYGNVFSRNVKGFKFSQNSPIQNFYIYEGIGSGNGLFSGRNDSFEVGRDLLCFEDTSGKFCNSQFILGNSESNLEKSLTLYYSKETQNYKIIGNPLLDYKISFYEATGRLLEEVNAKGNQSFYLKNTTKNILFYTITNQGKSWKGKIMVQ